jgi:hypothetical protein
MGKCSAVQYARFGEDLMIDAHPRHYRLVSGREDFGTLTWLSFELLNAHVPY